jgi:putative ABC transport system permease protein
LVTLIPAWRVTRANVNDTLKEGAGSLGDSQRLGRLRNSFVALQVALAVILLLSAGLMFRAFRRLQDAGVGFDPTNKLVVSLQLPEETSGQTISEDSAHLLERFQRLPWVAQVARGSGSPLQNGWTGGVKVDDRPGLGEIRCSINAVSAGYFSTMGIPFRAGRGFEGLRLGDPEVVVINETSVKRWFPGESPLGKRITYDGKTTMEIIGVVADIRDWRAQDPISPHIYLPTWQPPDSSTSLTFVLRLSGPAGLKFDEAIRRAAYEADPHIIVLQVSKLEDEVYQRVYLERSAMDLLKAVSILSVVLAAVGLFAVMAYAVAQRKREYGVRMALGASPENLQWFVLRNGMKVTLVGISIGLCAAWGLTRLLQSILFETSPHDPFAYVGSAVALFGVAALACWLPARRAANVDPVEALRAE